LGKIAELGARLMVTVLEDLPGHFERMTPQPTSGVTKGELESNLHPSNLIRLSDCSNGFILSN
jgi:hypothetical protein